MVPSFQGKKKAAAKSLDLTAAFLVSGFQVVGRERLTPSNHGKGQHQDQARLAVAAFP